MHMLTKSRFVRSSTVISPAAITAASTALRHYDQPEHLNFVPCSHFPFSQSHALTTRSTRFPRPRLNLHLLNHSHCFMSLHLLIICHSFIPSLSALFNRTQITPASIRPSLSLIHSVPLSFTLPSITPSFFSSTEPRLVSIHLYL